MEKGILSSKAEKKIGGTYLDDLVSAGMFEMIDGQAFTFAIKTLDNKFGELIPEPHKTNIRDLVDDIVVNESYDKAIDDACDYLDSIINLPFINDDAEKDVFNGFATMLKGIFKAIKKKAVK